MTNIAPTSLSMNGSAPLSSMLSMLNAAHSVNDASGEVPPPTGELRRSTRIKRPPSRLVVTHVKRPRSETLPAAVSLARPSTPAQVVSAQRSLSIPFNISLPPAPPLVRGSQENNANEVRAFAAPLRISSTNTVVAEIAHMALVYFNYCRQLQTAPLQSDMYPINALKVLVNWSERDPSNQLMKKMFTTCWLGYVDSYVVNCADILNGRAQTIYPRPFCCPHEAIASLEAIVNWGRPHDLTNSGERSDISKSLQLIAELQNTIAKVDEIRSQLMECHYVGNPGICFHTYLDIASIGRDGINTMPLHEISPSSIYHKYAYQVNHPSWALTCDYNRASRPAPAAPLNVLSNLNSAFRPISAVSASNASTILAAINPPN